MALHLPLAEAEPLQVDVYVQLRGRDAYLLLELAQRWNTNNSDTVRHVLRFTAEALRGKEPREPQPLPVKVEKVRELSEETAEDARWIAALRVLLGMPPEVAGELKQARPKKRKPQRSP